MDDATLIAWALVSLRDVLIVAEMRELEQTHDDAMSDDKNKEARQQNKAQFLAGMAQREQMVHKELRRRESLNSMPIEVAKTAPPFVKPRIVE